MSCFACLPSWSAAWRLGSSEHIDDRRGRYKMSRVLGQGDFGTVRIGEDTESGLQVAIKEFRSDKADKLDIQREIHIVRRLDHPHIVKLCDVLTSSRGTLMVMELLPNGDLLRYVKANKRLQESETRLFMQQLISSVSYCHDASIAHRDLKLENLMLDSEFNIKVVDFGLAREMVSGYVYDTPMGSPNYAAPEILHVDIDKYRGAPADMYSCGVVLYCCLTGKFPYSGAYNQLCKLVKKGNYKIPEHISTPAKTLLRQFMVLSPTTRITVPEVRDDEWFNEPIPFLEAQPRTSPSSVGQVLLGRTRQPQMADTYMQAKGTVAERAAL